MLENVETYLSNTRNLATALLALSEPKNEDYAGLERSLEALCLKVLIGTSEYFLINAIINNITMNRHFLCELSNIEDKPSFRKLCKKSLNFSLFS